MSHLTVWNIPSPVPETASEEQKLLLYGKDIFFNGDFDVGPNGDYVLLSGKEAMRQAIYRRLMTRPGEYKLRPEYGVGVQDFVKKRRLASTLDELRQRTIDQLSLDTRISEVVDIGVDLIDDGIQLKVAVRLAGETLRFEPFNFTEKALSGLVDPRSV
jgi:hypothetical protein